MADVIAPTNRDPTALGQQLREAREGRSLTRDEAAQAIGISSNDLARIESAERSLSTLELSRLAKLYRHPVAHFIAAEESPTSQEMGALVEAINAFDERDEDGRPLEKADRELVSRIIGLAVEAYRREDVSQGWLRDLSEEVGMPADELLALAEAECIKHP